MKKLADYILVLNDVITPTLCDAVLNEYRDCEDWAPAIVGSGKQATDVRNCETIGISFSSIIQKNLSVRKNLDTYLFISAAEVIKKYNAKFPKCEIEQDSGYELLKYKEGQFYTTHVDSFKERPRAVSCSFALNDDYEGGEFAFFDRELIYKLKKGSCIMFPSNFMYPHEIMPVISGTRYSIVTWFI